VATPLVVPELSETYRQHALEGDSIKRLRPEGPFFSDEEVLAAMAALRKELGRDISKTDMTRRSKLDPGFPTATSVRLHFGSWTRGCALIGQMASPKNLGRQPDMTSRHKGFWSRAEILTALHRLQAELGVPLSPFVIDKARSGRGAAGPDAVPSYQTLLSRVVVKSGSP
jgi:hypothetical protein